MLFRKKNKKEEKESQELAIKVNAERISDAVVKSQTARARETYKKPPYTSNRSLYDDTSARNKIKADTFSQNEVVTDPYTGKRLLPTKSEAIKKYGNDYMDHLYNGDHIDPLNNIVDRHQRDPFLTTDDIRAVANDRQNIQALSASSNQNSGKGGLTQEEWSWDDARMQKISDQSGSSKEQVKKEIAKAGKKAERTNNSRLRRKSMKNSAKTMAGAGARSAVYTGGTSLEMRAFYNIKACYNGEIDAKTAVQETLQGTVRDSGNAFVRDGLITGVNNVLAASDKQLLQKAAKSNAVGKTAYAVINFGKPVMKRIKGESDNKEFLGDMAGQAVSLGVTEVKAAAAAKIATVATAAIAPEAAPFVAVFCFMAISDIGDRLYNSISEAINYESEEDKRRKQEIIDKMIQKYIETRRQEEVKRLLDVATADAAMNSALAVMESCEFREMFYELGTMFTDLYQTQIYIAELTLMAHQARLYRRELERYIAENYRGYEDCFAPVMEYLDSSLKFMNFNDAIAATNQVTEAYGKEPVIKSTDDFRKKIFGGQRISF